ncbi:uncharacterized protein LOC121381395 [Gigantopelta aegis]|uniref:uncharacterized protein LOC121381395 n=1 Tax=Gigantopelta aegis TaxID=1735272 RepID=UPI001B887BC5|nr:uncharacterized protein LOC121381395 [Gigantopelta aegis]
MVVVKEIEENGENMAAAAEGSSTTPSSYPKLKDQQTSDLHTSSKPLSASDDKSLQTREIQDLSSAVDANSSTDGHSTAKLEQQAAVANSKTKGKSESLSTPKMKTVGKKQLKSVSMQQAEISSSKNKVNPDASQRAKRELKSVSMQQFDTPSGKGKVVPNTSHKVKKELKSLNMEQFDTPSSKGKVDPDTSQKELKSLNMEQFDTPSSKGKVDPDTSQKELKSLNMEQFDTPISKGKVDPDASQKELKSLSKQQFDTPSSKGKVDPETSHKVKKELKSLSMQQFDTPSGKGKVDPGTSHKVKKELKSVSMHSFDTPSGKGKVDPDTSHKVKKELKSVSMNQSELSGISSNGKVTPDTCHVKKELKSVSLQQPDLPLGKEKSGGKTSKSSSRQSAAVVELQGEKVLESATTKETNKMEEQRPGLEKSEVGVAEIKENQKKTKNKAKKVSKAKNTDALKKQTPSVHDQIAKNGNLDVEKSVSPPPSVGVFTSDISKGTDNICCNNIENVADICDKVSSTVKETSEDMDTASNNQSESVGAQNKNESVDTNICTGKTIPVVKFEALGEPSQSISEEVKPTSAGKTTEQLRPVFNSKHWIKNVTERLKRVELHDEVMLEFSQCKTDTQRFACLYMQPAVHEVIHVEEWNKEKSEVQARVLRTSGNKSYQRKQFKESLEMYTESILKAPVEGDSSELALAFANRSAVFYHLKMYALCLQDIHFALKYGYPEHNRYKLFERKGKCCYHLKMKEEAISAFEQAIEFAEKAKLSDLKIDRLVRDLEKELDQVEKINMSCKEIPSVNTFNNNHGPVPSVEGKVSYQFPYMTSNVVLKYTEERGRGLFAERDIEVGEVLIVEKPYNSVLLKGYEMNHCHHCCNSLLAPLPCHQCSGVAFCSEECRVKAWDLYHYAECKYLVLIEKAEIGMSHLALRMVLRAGFNYIKQYEQKKEDTMYPLLKGCNKDGRYDSSDYHTVFNLEGHSKDRSVTDLLQRTLTAIFLIKCLKRTSYFPPITAEESASDFGKDEDEEHALIGSHILRHIQMLPCNAHEVSELEWNSSDFELSEVCEFGSAIYPVLSLINHSCDPSVVRHSYGDVCVVRAIRNIYKHEELFDSYGALYATTNKSQRQEKLLSQYYFHCICVACQNDWPAYTDIPQECPVLKCKKCFGPIFIPSDGKNERAMCSSCREVHDITHDLLHLSRSEELYQDALEKTLKGKDLEECLPILIKHLRLLDPLLCRPWRDYNNCQEAIKQCYSTMANCMKGRKD